jgi:acetyl-CoA carboxylase biotin carboxyl carrier protein
MVGTIYMSPSPGEPPFVRPGESVVEGQTILMVEAMKTFNEIAAPRSGTLARIIVTDGQPVEFGEVLALIE